MIPFREALSSLGLSVTFAVAILLFPERTGPGPLALMTAVAIVYGALLSPLIGKGPAAWGLLPALLAVPAIAATSYGHPGLAPLLGSLLLALLAAASGTAARALGPARTGLYGATMVLAIALPYALHYVVQAHEDEGSAEGWLLVSPVAAADRVAAGAMPPLAAMLALSAWPVWAIARRAR